MKVSETDKKLLIQRLWVAEKYSERKFTMSYKELDKRL